LSSFTFSPPTSSHGLSKPYSQASPLPTSVPGLSQSYTVPTLASQYPHDDGRPSLGTNYTAQTSIPDLSPEYPPYTSSAPGRRRSSEVKTETYSATHYPTRPRANTSFSALYQATQDQSSDYSLSQLPSAGQAGRPSWDFNALFRSEPGSFSQDGTQGAQYRLPSRQASHASQYSQATATPTSQPAIQ